MPEVCRVTHTSESQYLHAKFILDCRDLQLQNKPSVSAVMGGGFHNGSEQAQEILLSLRKSEVLKTLSFSNVRTFLVPRPSRSLGSHAFTFVVTTFFDLRSILAQTLNKRLTFPNTLLMPFQTQSWSSETFDKLAREYLLLISEASHPLPSPSDHQTQTQALKDRISSPKPQRLAAARHCP